ncbi:hypothetical protein P691DRAFT_807366 [Macrolepiota fuliginosa MF-IS2]|uniref:Uncharacterized protein n=1 Tax=Macrolepiota fuliginosa MF-IS2 TaxID=1400762 RepID=A0A9P5X4Q6_9AGAR|nr:hypothetical protein P691DRAFT_807366 [Macrolepiota fuliginosa MF-IS2]
MIQVTPPITKAPPNVNEVNAPRPTPKPSPMARRTQAQPTNTLIQSGAGDGSALPDEVSGAPDVVRPASAQVGDTSAAFAYKLVTTTFVTSGVFTTAVATTLPNGKSGVLTLTYSGTHRITATTEIPT